MMTGTDRRAASRIESVVVVELDAIRHGVARNASERGLLIATRTKLTPGDRLEITVHGRRASIQTIGRVMRVEETRPTDAWRYRVALQLDDNIPADILEEGAETAARFLRHGSVPPPE
jgi:hypothetical protein